MISATKSKKALSQGGNYQDSVMDPLGRKYNDDSVGHYDNAEGEDDGSGSILTAVEKVHYQFIMHFTNIAYCFADSKDCLCNMIKPPAQTTVAQSSGPKQCLCSGSMPTHADS